eukprot:353841-Chlamydomonas_euryale.AAC.4
MGRVRDRAVVGHGEGRRDEMGTVCALWQIYDWPGAPVPSPSTKARHIGRPGRCGEGCVGNEGRHSSAAREWWAVIGRWAAAVPATNEAGRRGPADVLEFGMLRRPFYISQCDVTVGTGGGGWLALL